MALSNHEKSELRAKAQALKCSVTVGKGGLTEAVREQIRRAFTGKDLVKVRIQHPEREELDRVAQEIAESVPCDLVARLGFTATFFRLLE